MNIEFLIKKIKDNELLRIFLYFFSFTCIVAFIFLPYILKFGGSGFSDSTTVWAEYGSYISGVTSFLNLLVFIFLTIYVAQLGDSNNKKQLDVQLKIVRANFQQTELQKYNEEIYKTYLSYGNDELIPFTKSLIYLNLATLSLMNIKFNVFPILKEPDFRELVMDYAKFVKDFSVFLSKYANYDDYLKVNDDKYLGESMTKLKADGENITRILQDSIFIDLEPKKIRK